MIKVSNISDNIYEGWPILILRGLLKISFLGRVFLLSCKLPSSHQVFLCLLAHMQEFDLSPTEAAKKVVPQIVWFYGKGGNPTLQENKIYYQEIMKLKGKLDKVVKISKDRGGDKLPQSILQCMVCNLFTSFFSYQ